MGRKIRGVRVCQNEECRLPQNRDRTDASNIGLQFGRLYEGKSPIREIPDEEAEFNRLNVTLHAYSECEETSEGLRSPGVADTTTHFTVYVFTVAKEKQTPVIP